MSRAAGGRAVIERDAGAVKQALDAVAAGVQTPLPYCRSTTRNTTENGELLQQTHATLAQWDIQRTKDFAEFQVVFTDPVAEKPLGQYYAGIASWRQLESKPTTSNTESQDKTRSRLRMSVNTFGRSRAP